MSGRRSRSKGQVGERELAAVLTEAGFPAHRGRQYRGGQDSPDVICPRLDAIYSIECKFTEKLSLYPALEQARRDGGGQRVPLVCHRRNHKEWLAVLPLADFLKLLKRLED